MPKGLFQDGKEHVAILDYEDSPLSENQIRIKSEFSAIKHGTFFHVFSGESPFETMTFDRELRMFRQAPSRASRQGRSRIGNTTVGVIEEVGTAVEGFAVGDRVYTSGLISETVTRDAGKVEHLIPPMTARDAVCMDPAQIALAAVRDAPIHVGESVAVFGLGAIGQFVVQFLRLNGCLDVVAVDPIEKRRKLAETFGATATFDPTACDVGTAVREHLGHPADCVIEASGNYRALHAAMRSVQQCGSVVTLGYYKGAANDLYLGQEWLHNRLTLICSMPDWDNPPRDYPMWSKARLTETLKRMFADGRLNSEGILDPIVPLEQAADAFMSIYRDPTDAIKLGVTY